MSSRRRVNKTKKKKKTYFKNYDLYSDANPKDTVRIRYKSTKDVRDTIKKLERMYKSGKISHARNVRIVNVMTQRLKVIKRRNPKIDKGRYKISKLYFERLKKRTKTKRKRKKTKKTKNKTKRKKKNNKKKRYKKMYKMMNEAYKPELLNIYNEKLKPCGNRDMGNGSWDEDYMCSEMGGGVHQICVNKIGVNTNKFSKNTGQSDWSSDRGNNNHCVCLGAWSLYNYKKNKKELSDIHTKKLKCDSIPNYSLSDRYVKKFVGSNEQGWEEWNNNEGSNQIIDGVESMVHECYNEGNNEQKMALRNNYCNFARNNSKLHTSYYKEMC